MNADDSRDYMLSLLSDSYEQAAKKELGRDYPDPDAIGNGGKTLLFVWYKDNPATWRPSNPYHPVMPLDFSKIAAPSTADTVVNPREIFAILPGKQPKYGYLRDVQAEVLDQWFGRRATADLRLKMNTGGGKTVVGLLILKSCLNENKGPAVYIAPTPYLATQVVQEAKALGLAVDEDPRSVAVARGKAILVTSIYVLLNGKSKFGVGDVQIPIGSLVLDDAHACLATAEEQFTLDLVASHPTYTKLFALFRSDLEGQSSSGVLDVEQHEPYADHPAVQMPD